jgi:hypothetical protein
MLWKLKSGKLISITELDDQHLINILRLLKRNATSRWLFVSSMFIKMSHSHDEVDKQLEEHLQETWEDYLQDNFYDLEQLAEERKLDWDLWPGGPATDASLIEQVEVAARGPLESRIVGALRDCVNAHGPITRETAPSAAKRIIGAIKDHNKQMKKGKLR